MVSADEVFCKAIMDGFTEVLENEFGYEGDSKKLKEALTMVSGCQVLLGKIRSGQSSINLSFGCL